MIPFAQNSSVIEPHRYQILKFDEHKVMDPSRLFDKTQKFLFEFYFRTRDPYLARVVLYRTELRAHYCIV